MKYTGMPFGLWLVFAKSFERNLTDVFDLTPTEAVSVMTRAKKKYKEIIGNIPEFEKGDRFRMNIIGAVMLAALVLNMPTRPDVERLTVYYRNAMMTAPMRFFCRMSGKKKFTQQDIENMKKTAAFRAADRNAYSWNMDFYPYPDNSGYEARFTACGICTLMRELGLFDLVPAMCALDYAMSDAAGASHFARECTLANGDAYCDCGYKKRRIT